jgi:hypothetical protein
VVGQVWQGSAGLESGEAGQFRRGLVGYGAVECGLVRRGEVRQVRRGNVALGVVRCGLVMQVSSVPVSLGAVR